MSDRSRLYTTRRTAISKALVDLIKDIDGTNDYVSNLSGQVYDKLRYIEDISDFPAVCVIAGSETRSYKTSEYKDRYIGYKILIFVNEENPLTKLDNVLEDIETVLESNARFQYLDKTGAAQYSIDITILNISTDEGALEPIAIGEMSILVHY